MEDRRKEEKMTAPITLPSLDEPTLTELRRCYEGTSDAETRTRYQMLLLSQRGQTSSQIAQNVMRSPDTVVRVLKGFLTSGAGHRQLDEPLDLPCTWASTQASRLPKRRCAYTYMLMASSVSAPPGRMPAQS